MCSIKNIFCFLISFFCCCICSFAKQPILVLGSEPECITAAVTASKLGYPVTLLTQSSTMGGLFTEGMLTALDINYDHKGSCLHKGFFTDFLSSCSNGYNLDYILTQQYFDSLISMYSIHVIKEVTHLAPIVKNKQVYGVAYTKNGQTHYLSGSFIIDGTNDATFSRQLGIPYRKGRSEFGKPDTFAAASLLFSLNNVDWNGVTTYLANDHNPQTGSKQNSAWGFSNLYHYVASNSQLQMRGLNLSRQNDKSVIVNALLLFHVDPLNPTNKKQAFLVAKKELPSIIQYIRLHCPGFSDANLRQTADMLYIREGIRMIGFKTLSSHSIFSSIHFPDTIAYGSYPIDLQATDCGHYGSALSGHLLYSIPLGCMSPKNFTNLMWIGRSSSFDIIAHGSARTVPVLMQMAENGTFAIHYALENQISLQELATSNKHLQTFYSQLKKYNGFKKLTLPKNSYIKKWYYPSLCRMREKGYFSFGYTDYSLESTKNTKKTILVTTTLLEENSLYTLCAATKDFLHALPNEVTIKEMCTLCSLLLEKHYPSLQSLYEEGILNDLYYKNLRVQKHLTHAQVLAILDSVIQKLPIPSIAPIYQDTPLFIQKTTP